MKKRIGLATTGLVSILVAVFLFSLFLMSLNDSANFLYFGGSIIFAAIMVYCFIKTNAPVAPAPSTREKPATTISSNILENNNTMIKSFNDTEKTQERLRVMESIDSGSNGPAA